jgi:hypothetical protein
MQTPLISYAVEASGENVVMDVKGFTFTELSTMVSVFGLLTSALLTAGCSKDQFEPNNNRSVATRIEQDMDVELSISPGDQDWFEVGVPDAQISTVGIEYTHMGPMGKLGLQVYHPDLEYLGEDLAATNRSGWVGQAEAYRSVLNLSGEQDYYFGVSGKGVTANSYTLSVEKTPYTDGRDCPAEYGLDECLGLAEGQLMLHQFPFPDPNDGFVGNGYVLQTYPNYQWARREIIMYVRYAIHEVQQRYPGTNTLGIVDISQRDGVTPGADVGSLRHPATTHDQGGNIDVAYYQTEPDSRARTICDVEGGSNNGYFCDESATDTHIVDLERTAYFIARLASMHDVENPRLRVVGVDRMIGPLLDEMVLELKEQGVISEEEYTNAYNRIAYGDGWPFHHHHMHLSFQWWDADKTSGQATSDPPIGCGFRMHADPPLQIVP